MSNELIIALFTFGFVLTGIVAARQVMRGLKGGMDPELEARIRDLERPREATESRISILRQTVRSEIPTLDRWLKQIKFTARIERLLMQAGSAMATSEFLLFSALIAVATLLTARVALSIPWPGAVALALVGASVLPLLLIQRRASRYRRLTEQLPETLELMASSLRAGHAYTAAVQVVAEELEDPIAGEFQVMVDQYRVGLDQRACLNLLVERVDIPDLRLLATAVLIQLESGGNLAEALDKLADVIRARFKLAGQVRAITAEGRLSGAILGALPIVVGVIITLLNPEYLKPLFRNPIGLMMVVMAVVLEFAGFMWIRRIVAVRP
jgi:tight adherence protein B